MKLSFSTKGWHGKNFAELCSLAKDLRFSGIELHNVRNELFTTSDSAFRDYSTVATLRDLYELKLSIPCIDSICDPADPAQKQSAMDELTECIRVAGNFHIPYIRLHASAHGEDDMNIMQAFLTELLPKAEAVGVTLLLETSGLFSNTKVLREFLNTFACDSLAALWDMYSSYFVAGEEPESTIENLGAYVKHIHLLELLLF